jgi:DNA ligase (NAD+)
MQASQFLTKLKQLDYTKLEEVKGLGSVLIANLNEFIKSNRFEQLLENFKQLELNNMGLNLTSAQVNPQGVLSGQTICITGTFNESRDAIALRLTSLGAKITTAVTSATTILLVGEKPGSKLTKAESLGIKVVYSVEEII